MLKLYVYDHGWDGAEIFFAESEQQAKEWVRDMYLPEYQKRDQQHRESETYKHMHNPWTRHVEEYSTLDFSVSEYEIKPGFVCSTDGGS